MSRKVRKNVGVIGLGIIGSRVAAGLRGAGYQVYVWNRSAKPAPNFLGSPAEVAESAEIIQIFVADAQALFDVVEAMSQALTPKHVVVCNATVGPEAVLEAAQLVEARGAQFLDAPFTGSKIAAEKRQLVYYVGGSEPAFLRVRPILELTSKAIIRMGDIGHASTIKVVTNMISAVTVQVLSEALSIVQKAGLEPELLSAAIEQNACRSGVIDLKLPKMMSGDYEPHFSLKHMFKDVQLGIHMANALDIEIPATTVTAGVMYGALNQGWGDLDYAALFKNYAPAEIFEELPAIEQVLGPGESAGPESTLDLGHAGGAHTAPLTLPHAASSEPVIGNGNAEPPAPPKAAATFASTNGAPARETVPTEEAARIIEAVLAHVTGQRAETNSLNAGSIPARPVDTEPAAGTLPPVERLDESMREGESKAASPDVATSTPPNGEKTPLPAADSNAEDAAKSESADSKGESKAPNFMRRWFVGRAQD